MLIQIIFEFKFYISKTGIIKSINVTHKLYLSEVIN